MATIEIPVSDDGENWMNEVRRKKGEPKDPAVAAALARKMVEQLEQSPDPKAPSRPTLRTALYVTATAADPLLLKYNPSQDRATDGKWTDGGGFAGAAAAKKKKPATKKKKLEVGAAKPKPKKAVAAPAAAEPATGAPSAAVVAPAKKPRAKKPTAAAAPSEPITPEQHEAAKTKAADKLRMYSERAKKAAATRAANKAAKAKAAANTDEPLTENGSNRAEKDTTSIRPQVKKPADKTEDAQSAGGGSPQTQEPKTGSKSTTKSASKKSTTPSAPPSQHEESSKRIPPPDPKDKKAYKAWMASEFRRQNTARAAVLKKVDAEFPNLQSGQNEQTQPTPVGTDNGRGKLQTGISEHTHSAMHLRKSALSKHFENNGLAGSGLDVLTKEDLVTPANRKKANQWTASWVSNTTKAKADEAMAAMTVPGSWAQEQYLATQAALPKQIESLRRRGVEIDDAGYITLYRGIHGDQAEQVRAQLTAHGKANLGVYGLTSWTSDRHTADKFALGQKTADSTKKGKAKRVASSRPGISVKQKIHISRVFASYATENDKWRSAGEKEFTIMHPEQSVHVDPA